MSVQTFKSAYKILTGAGAIFQLREEVQRLGMSNPLIVSDKIIDQAGLLTEVTNVLKGISYGQF